MSLCDILSHIENGREAEKEKMKFHKLLMAARNYCYYYFLQRLRWQCVCNALRDGEEPKLSSLFMNYNYLNVFNVRKQNLDTFM